MDKIVTRSRAACNMMENSDQNTDDIQVSVIKYFDRKINELQEGFPSKNFLEEINNFMIEQMNKIEKLDSTVTLLQEHVKELKLSNERLLSKVISSNMNVDYDCSLKIFLSWKMKQRKLF